MFLHQQAYCVKELKIKNKNSYINGIRKPWNNGHVTTYNFKCEIQVFLHSIKGIGQLTEPVELISATPLSFDLNFLKC